MASTKRAAGALLLTAILAAGTTLAGAEQPAEHPQLGQVRRETARYHDPAVAVAEGYVATEACAAHPQLGGMGFHYVNPSLLSDPGIDPTKPEVLLYEELADGRLRLVAVEWFAVDPDQDLSTDAGRPVLFDVPFDGPMAGHEPGMPVHFDLHAWVWKHNPEGVFFGWNPRVTCEP
ncbi:MAG: hypothetical protein M3P85_08930 [Actinomycetota bacterium]|nr:hypothetical protein [Actinomycetota bacterium]